MYHPVILFTSKQTAKTPFEVIYGKHYEATFPQVYKTKTGATNFATRNLVPEHLDMVWQLPGAVLIKEIDGHEEENSEAKEASVKEG